MARRFWDSNVCLVLRHKISMFRSKFDIFYRIKQLENAYRALENNLGYESESPWLEVPDVMTSEETLKELINSDKSLARYGDAEFCIASGGFVTYQDHNPVLQQKLIQVLKQPINDCLVCVPRAFGQLSMFNNAAREFWRWFMRSHRDEINKLLCEFKFKNRDALVPCPQLGDAFVSRPYMDYVNKRTSEKVFLLWKKLFSGKSLLIVEGRYSRLGVGNDLFGTAVSIRRIWCPALNAFSKYEEIRKAVSLIVRKDEMVLIALGPTATVLAYDLASVGIRALDVGHIDVEYLWMKMKTTKKVPIKGRYVNECNKGWEMVKVAGEETRLGVVKVIE